MAIKNYENKAAYNSAVKSTIESQVSLIETSREIIIDGVNIVTTEPVTGDLLFLDESNNRVYLKGGSWIQKAIIPSAWVHIGYVFRRFGRQVLVVDKTGVDRKYADVLQYSITAISSTSVTISLRDSSGTIHAVSVTLSSAAINATTAAQISSAVSAANIDSNAWWAYLADADGNQVTSGGTQIIVQCDTWSRYDQYYCAMTGGTIAFTTWGDMPASDVYFKNDGGYTNYWGVMNVARTRAWATSNGRVPETMEPIKVTGNPAPVKPSCFEDSTDAAYQYTALIRAEYGTYDNYLRNGYGVKYPQKYGTFGLPSGHELTKAYALKTAPTKSGGEKYKYPAFYQCYSTSYGVDGLDYGDFFLPGSLEGCYLMHDDTIGTLAPSITKMGTTAINNSTYRWFAERYDVYSARFFGGYSGSLYSAYVCYAFRVQPVALLEI